MTHFLCPFRKVNYKTKNDYHEHKNKTATLQIRKVLQIRKERNNNKNPTHTFTRFHIFYFTPSNTDLKFRKIAETRRLHKKRENKSGTRARETRKRAVHHAT